jgi:hypothetical protein
MERKMERLLHDWAVGINPSGKNTSSLLPTKGASAAWGYGDAVMPKKFKISSPPMP